MHFQQRMCAYLSQKRVPFTIEHSEGASFVDGSPLGAAWRDPALAQVVLVFVGRQLAMLVLRAGTQTDPELLRDAFDGREVSLIEADVLGSAFPDVDVNYLPPLGEFWQMPVYVDDELSGEPTIRFFAGNANDVVTLRRADFDRLNQPALVRVAARPPALSAVSNRELAGVGTGAGRTLG